MLNRIIIEINFIFSARKFEIMVVVFIVFPSDSSEIDSSQRFSAFGEKGEWRELLSHILEKIFSVH